MQQPPAPRRQLVTAAPVNDTDSCFDNGDGIRPEHIDVLAKAGASTVRDDDIQAPVRGALLAHEAGGRGGRSQGSRGSAYGHREFGRLRAEWGRYGVGRYAQLNGTETKVRFVSVAKGVTKLIVFEQDMAEMAHQKTITYDYHVYDHGTRECARVCDQETLSKAFLKLSKAFLRLS